MQKFFKVIAISTFLVNIAILFFAPIKTARKIILLLFAFVAHLFFCVVFRKFKKARAIYVAVYGLFAALLFLLCIFTSATEKDYFYIISYAPLFVANFLVDTFPLFKTNACEWLAKNKRKEILKIAMTIIAVTAFSINLVFFFIAEWTATEKLRFFFLCFWIFLVLLFLSSRKHKFLRMGICALLGIVSIILFVALHKQFSQNQFYFLLFLHAPFFFANIVCDILYERIFKNLGY